jgi:DNA polymerase III alpha subunit (gram-positive type)
MITKKLINWYRSCLNRNIVLVGHDIEADIKYLNVLGFNPCDIPNLREQVDTASMYRAYRREPHTRSLGGILVDLNIAGWDLHNAGNDATYTLQAMVGIALRAKQEKQDKNSRDQKKKNQVDE